MAKYTKYSRSDLLRDFPNDTACLQFIFEQKHSYECSCGGTYRLIKTRRQYQCSRCRFQISPSANTIFHKTLTPLTLWFHALFIFSNAKSGVSAQEMERQLGVTEKTAWRMLRLIRSTLVQEKVELEGEVEIDSAYLSGKGKRGDIHKKAVAIAAVTRHGLLRARVVGGMGGGYVRKFIYDYIGPKATVMSDQSPSYIRPGKTYKIRSVNHSKKEYVRGRVHVNTIEGFWSHVKRSIRGTFKTVSKRHLQSYLDAFVFHYNMRHNDRERFWVLLDAVRRA